ncbi:hypothetical protein ABTM07_19930, partial [Acinetobacter baumannii]
GAASPDAAEVRSAIERILAAAAQAAKPACLPVGGAPEAQAFARHGVRCFLVGSDQALLRQAAASARADLSQVG